MLRSTLTVGSATVLSRVFGLARDMVIARVFGANAMTDGFWVAFRIPNFMRRLFGEGSFSLAFVPVLSEYRQQRDPAEVRALVDHVAGTLMAVLLVVVGCLVLAAPGVLHVVAPGFVDDPATFATTTDMLRLTAPYVGFISLVAMAGGALNAHGRFAVPALTPILLNIALIVAAWWGARAIDPPIVALAWGVLFAGVIQLAFQLPSLSRLGLLPRPRWGWNHPGVKKIRRLMIPTLFGSSVAQINLLIDTAIATMLVAGSNTWLYYSDRLLEFPLGVFAIALSTVILPGLSRQHAGGDRIAFSRSLDWGLRWGLLIGPPAALGLALLAEPLMVTLFQYDRFDAFDARMSALSLAALALGLPAWIFIKIVAPAFYARQDTRSPVIAGVIAMVTNVALNLLIVFVLMDPQMNGRHAGLALASSLAGWVNLGLLAWMLARADYYQTQRRWLPDAGLCLLATAAMAPIVWWLTPPSEIWAGWEWHYRALRLALVVVAGAAAYALVLGIGGLRFRHLAGPQS